MADQRRILIIDDDQDLHVLLDVKLQKANVILYHALNTEMAINYLKGIRFDLAFIDIVLGAGVSSNRVIEFLKNQSEDEINFDLPFVVMSAYMDQEYGARLQRKHHNVIKFFIKPLKTNDIRYFLDNLFRDLEEDDEDAFLKAAKEKMNFGETLVKGSKEEEEGDILVKGREEQDMLDETLVKGSKEELIEDVLFKGKVDQEIGGETLVKGQKEEIKDEEVLIKGDKEESDDYEVRIKGEREEYGKEKNIVKGAKVAKEDMIQDILAVGIVEEDAEKRVDFLDEEEALDDIVIVEGGVVEKPDVTFGTIDEVYEEKNGYAEEVMTDAEAETDTDMEDHELFVAKDLLEEEEQESHAKVNIDEIRSPDRKKQEAAGTVEFDEHENKEVSEVKKEEDEGWYVKKLKTERPKESKVDDDVNARNEKGETALMRNAGEGNVEMVRALIRAGANVHCRNKMGMNSLHYAVGAKNIEVIGELIKHGCELNCRDERNAEPLAYAITRGNVEVLDFLIKKGAKLNRRVNSRSYLMLAARRGDPDVFEYLLKTDIDPNIKDRNGDTVHDILKKKNSGGLLQLLDFYKGSKAGK